MIVDNRNNGGVTGVTSVNTRDGDVVLTSTDVGLGNVDNTSDANKPVSTATQTALDLKENILHPSDGFKIKEHWLATTAVGTNGWTLTTNSGTVGTTASVGSGTIMGIARMGTLTSATAAPVLSLGNGNSFVMNGLEHTFETHCKIANLSTVSEEFIWRLGYQNTTTGTLTSHGIFFEYDRLTSTNWRIRTLQGGTGTATDTGVAVDTNWNTFKIVVNSAATSVTFYINGVSVGTHTTNIPAGTSQLVSPTYQLVKSAGTTTRETYIDWAEIQAA
jgi:hypothetical protein